MCRDTLSRHAIENDIDDSSVASDLSFARSVSLVQSDGGATGAIVVRGGADTMRVFRAAGLSLAIAIVALGAWGCGHPYGGGGFSVGAHYYDHDYDDERDYQRDLRRAEQRYAHDVQKARQRYERDRYRAEERYARDRRRDSYRAHDRYRRDRGKAERRYREDVAKASHRLERDRRRARDRRYD